MNNFQPTVSVIVPAYNAAKTLLICLNSLIHQDYPREKYSVIVVNDGSNDATGTLLRQMNLPENFGIIEHPENRGLAAARNTGIQNANGDIIIFLDSDMEVAQDFIAQHASWYIRSEVVGIIGELRPAPEIPYDKYQRYLYESKRGARVIGANEPLPFQYFIFGITSVKRSALATIGGFNADIRQYGGEDTELAYRLWQKYPTGLFFDPEIIVIHHHYRPFPQVLKIVEQFGRQVVPYIVEKHPELSRLYGMQFVKPLGGNNWKLKYWIGRTLQTNVALEILWFLFEIKPYPISNFLVRGLLASALLRGITASRT
ncbi:MAG TPA: glycosyltransferase family 2 protein [Candidatus Marinimicrobia bacterium]|nr:glycosyltransferase family 2 protein [Candidatus Neomarinimicrobiota bacterium]